MFTNREGNHIKRHENEVSLRPNIFNADRPNLCTDDRADSISRCGYTKTLRTDVCWKDLTRLEID